MPVQVVLDAGAIGGDAAIELEAAAKDAAVCLLGHLLVHMPFEPVTLASGTETLSEDFVCFEHEALMSNVKQWRRPSARKAAASATRGLGLSLQDCVHAAVSRCHASSLHASLLHQIVVITSEKALSNCPRPLIAMAIHICKIHILALSTDRDQGGARAISGSLESLAASLYPVAGTARTVNIFVAHLNSRGHNQSETGSASPVDDTASSAAGRRLRSARAVYDVASLGNQLSLLLTEHFRPFRAELRFGHLSSYFMLYPPPSFVQSLPLGQPADGGSVSRALHSDDSGSLDDTPCGMQHPLFVDVHAALTLDVLGFVPFESTRLCKCLPGGSVIPYPASDWNDNAPEMLQPLARAMLSLGASAVVGHRGNPIALLHTVAVKQELSRQTTLYLQAFATGADLTALAAVSDQISQPQPLDSSSIMLGDSRSISNSRARVKKAAADPDKLSNLVHELRHLQQRILSLCLDSLHSDVAAILENEAQSAQDQYKQELHSLLKCWNEFRVEEYQIPEPHTNAETQKASAAATSEVVSKTAKKAAPGTKDATSPTPSSSSMATSASNASGRRNSNKRRHSAGSSQDVSAKAKSRKKETS